MFSDYRIISEPFKIKEPCKEQKKILKVLEMSEIQSILLKEPRNDKQQKHIYLTTLIIVNSYI